MQKAKQHYFKDRALFYLSFPIQSQAQKGDWDFKLNPVFLVAILDFEYDKEEERRKLYRLVTLKDFAYKNLPKSTTNLRTLGKIFSNSKIRGGRFNRIVIPFHIIGYGMIFLS
jgi:hypothetical protein